MDKRSTRAAEREARLARRSLWEGMYRGNGSGRKIPVLEGKPLRELLLRIEEKKQIKPPVKASRHTHTRLMSIIEA